MMMVALIAMIAQQYDSVIAIPHSSCMKSCGTGGITCGMMLHSALAMIAMIAIPHKFLTRMTY